jgi:hypothetical protein|tara:strand:+ start:383 stop:571 length:189 start_codon:yes stop_codon:yes gene_type:complete
VKKEYFDALSDHLSDKQEDVDEDKDTVGDYKYRNPKTGEVFTYTRKGIYRKDGTLLIYKGKT